MRKLLLLAMTVTALFGATTAQARETAQAKCVREAHGAIQDFRTQVWKRQDMLGISRSRASKAPILGCAYSKWVVRLWHKRLNSLPASLNSEAAIRYVFGPYADQALGVARCESGLRTWAQNGQYLGLFQMGTYARQMYGHGNDALTQARAAYRYFIDSGRNWSPWQCQPSGNLQW